MAQLVNGSSQAEPEGWYCNVMCTLYCATDCFLLCLLDPSPITDVAYGASMGFINAAAFAAV